MSDTATSVQDKAREAASWFETATRPDSSPFVRVKDGAPDWVGELVYHAHGGDFLPDDWRYLKIRYALEFIAEGNDEDSASEFADESVDVYTRDRLAWLSSNLNRLGYCDEAASEFGYSENAKAGITDRIGWGQYMEAAEIYGLVLDYLQDS